VTGRAKDLVLESAPAMVSATGSVPASAKAQALGRASALVLETESGLVLGKESAQVLESVLVKASALASVSVSASV
jgi:hypothetical protein